LAWSDEEFRARIVARAAELGISLAGLLEAAGVSREVFYKVPISGRRIDTLEKIAAACNWTLAEVMGLEERPSVELMELALASARRVMAGLPKWARTEQLFAHALTYLYDELVGLRRTGVSPTAEHLKACERILIHAWGSRDRVLEPGSIPPPK
jgi:hypothetical protein